jgi:hypothetical protein
MNPGNPPERAGKPPECAEEHDFPQTRYLDGRQFAEKTSWKGKARDLTAPLACGDRGPSPHDYVHSLNQNPTLAVYARLRDVEL